MQMKSFIWFMISHVWHSQLSFGYVLNNEFITFSKEKNRLIITQNGFIIIKQNQIINHNRIQMIFNNQGVLKNFSYIRLKRRWSHNIRIHTWFTFRSGKLRINFTFFNQSEPFLLEKVLKSKLITQSLKNLKRRVNTKATCTFRSVGFIMLKEGNVSIDVELKGTG